MAILHFITWLLANGFVLLLAIALFFSLIEVIRAPFRD